jgi:hypothetical protein
MVTIKATSNGEWKRFSIPQDGEGELLSAVLIDDACTFKHILAK